MKTITICILLGSLLIATIQMGASQEENAPIISLIIDVDAPPSPNEAEVRSAEVNLHKMYESIADNRHKTATLILNQDVTSSRIRLLLAQYTVLSNFEFVISGKHSDDLLSNMSFSDQVMLIKNSIRIAEAARVCGMSEVEVLGFMPPGFDQNEDTYEAMDNLSIKYNAGFQVGLIYAPGHKSDVWPYEVEGYNFSAVPISTVEVSGELLPIYDKRMVEEEISAAEWGEILQTKLDESAANGEPMVVLLSTSTSATGDYFDTFVEFLGYAISEDAVFVNARDLVTIATTGTLTLPEGGTYECPTCGQDEGMDISITRETPEPAKSTNETFENVTVEAIA